MGYRSDVDILVYGPKDQMAAFIAAERLINTGLKDDLDHVKYREYTVNYSSEPETWMLMWAHFEDVKWYPDYPDVACWEELFARAVELCEDPDSALCAEKAVIGEEYDDNLAEYHGEECEHFLSISRSISVDIPQEPKEGETS